MSGDCNYPVLLEVTAGLYLLKDTYADISEATYTLPQEKSAKMSTGMRFESGRTWAVEELNFELMVTVMLIW